ncbi:adenosylcobinamide-phosphate synthase CbiB [Rhodobacter capsulatus]|jgi:adenosylcobinamide-phosphate synthase|uniref:Cobalamin biosynthesis protein CobD n=1 Tax=Rhodobacter capsulatus (strain ATCC BAA-309 / NBRC 16581 / SB1003) TaxID=272942 RepID=COBD_RHOCB|nr:adenosylcobinamide-phosphate synthase CbiB [Rhodobacter capsulatus]D5AV16.1 RecName: Full=Cobalamin biosynthesis protein CobD [Rhodobacter capsulatus SB 1003]AAC16177.1 CobD protein [Rhodobacter capsulatus SB 1003]ADE85798.1 cobalamin biosynthesis protein CobD [Rhodobacter capsulatus SB 1003]ETD01798.1 cobalamin biosynthesis protein CobD [Rhodobacter capsulatus DE442]ETD76866.1 cobalamin biosynthesis protein CobD [Rhodobacter capsulatus R121]ETE53703.1 cobalamin biosynthesis protein CobD [
MNFAAMMVVAIGIDLALGWPDALYKRIGHPVTWIGALIARLEKGWNFKGRLRRLRGVLVALAVIGTTVVIALAVQLWLPAGWPGVLIGGILAWPFVALRSMHDHVAAVAKPLIAGDLPGARQAVSMIVGRDPSQLDQPGVARAALESLAENSSDGIVAPLFWGCVAGLPGIAGYKAINTLDSMIGHRTDRYEEFGWASARIDDLVNLIPARLTGLFFALASPCRARALAVMARDARSHRSPNAGWPEAAMAGALAVRLSGPRIYADRVANEPWLNGTAPDPRPADLARGLALYRRAMAGMTLVIGLVAVLWSVS